MCAVLFVLGVWGDERIMCDVPYSKLVISMPCGIKISYLQSEIQFVENNVQTHFNYELASMHEAPPRIKIGFSPMVAHHYVHTYIHACE